MLLQIDKDLVRTSMVTVSCDEEGTVMLYKDLRAIENFAWPGQGVITLLQLSILKMNNGLNHVKSGMFHVFPEFLIDTMSGLV